MDQVWSRGDRMHTKATLSARNKNAGFRPRRSHEQVEILVVLIKTEVSIATPPPHEHESTLTPSCRGGLGVAIKEDSRRIGRRFDGVIGGAAPSASARG